MTYTGYSIINGNPLLNGGVPPVFVNGTGPIAGDIIVATDSGDAIWTGIAGAGATGPQGATGVQGATGPQGATGTFITSQSTSVWQPTSSYFINEYFVSLKTQASGGVGPTGVFFIALSNGTTDINTTVLGSNGMTGGFKSDINTTIMMQNNIPSGIGNAQSILRNSNQASGWTAGYIYTGPNVGVLVSTPTSPMSGATGVVNWSLLIQLNVV